MKRNKTQSIKRRATVEENQMNMVKVRNKLAK